MTTLPSFWDRDFDAELAELQRAHRKRQRERWLATGVLSLSGAACSTSCSIYIVQCRADNWTNRLCFVIQVALAILHAGLIVSAIREYRKAREP